MRVHVCRITWRELGAHLSDAKVYSEILRHYWWLGMHRDVTHWTNGCIICTNKNAVKSTLTLILVAETFDQIGVNVTKYPKTSMQVVFADYQTNWLEVYICHTRSITNKDC